MGLDMYLNKRVYAGWKAKAVVTPRDFDDNLKEEETKEYNEVVEVVQRVGYWRKANAIHQWFVDNCQGGIDECQPNRVEIEKLLELKALCDEVLADPKKAPKLLPTQEGFFFGTTEYDEYYFDDLKETVRIIDDIVKNDDGDDYEYRASW